MKKILVSIFTVLCLGILINCASVQTKNPHIQREWMLVSLNGFTKDQLIKNKAGINLTASKEGQKIKGGAFMGCNKMFFTSEFKSNGKVSISGLGSTMMACQNMDLETYFSTNFEKMTKYSVEGHFLTLSDDKGNQMKFVAADWD
ncbi:META domain-containing protein [Chryseobacterium sp. JUb7]|uniref:META domain-containing protein n=1 Tax=Chryseobacterium sp. JUb7 TaxID=2940599 RepID=UPI0021694E21|nr:META domain-containing protein [Chryseobacterium sp. JUb7]MCS3530105.1 heat shock protein HslJ [Chryseobacterium sp. JUb7]